jgi:hypothetical protein
MRPCAGHSREAWSATAGVRTDHRGSLTCVTRVNRHGLASLRERCTRILRCLGVSSQVSGRASAPPRARREPDAWLPVPGPRRTRPPPATMRACRIRGAVAPAGHHTKRRGRVGWPSRQLKPCGPRDGPVLSGVGRRTEHRRKRSRRRSVDGRDTPYLCEPFGHAWGQSAQRARAVRAQDGKEDGAPQ